MKSDLMVAINQICHERQLSIEVVLEALEVALISAYKRNHGGNHSITAKIDSKSGAPQIFVEKAVVDEIQNERGEILLEEAKSLDRNAELGQLISIESTPANFGRIAAQTAKQVILQRIREAERDALYSTYAEREGEIVSGTVHKIDSHQVTLSLGKVEAFLPRSEQIPTERYGEGQRLRAYVSSVAKANRGPQIIVSRTHRNMLRRLLEVEVPEIYNGTVEIKSIAREAGYRSKVAVAALQEGVDPVGSCVGMRGTRIQNIVNELNGEKIDVVQWNPDLSFFIANSLSPARVMNVMLHDDHGKTAVVVVPDKQLSLAIGKEGQNARLAAKLTGWRIDIKSASEAIAEALQKVKTNTAINTRLKERMEVFNMAAMIIDGKEPLEFSDGELKVISEAIEAVNLAEIAISREQKARQIAQISAADVTSDKARDILAEAEAILSGQSLKPADDEAESGVVEEPELDVDDSLFDDEDLLGAAEELLVTDADVAAPAVDEELEPDDSNLAADIVSAASQMLKRDTVTKPDHSPPPTVEPEPEPVVAEEDPDDVLAKAEALLFDGPAETEEAPTKPEAKPTPEGTKPDVKPEGKLEPVVAVPASSADDLWDDDDEDPQREKKRAKAKKRRLVYDERLGEVVMERRRKHSRRGSDWEDWMEEE